MAEYNKLLYCTIHSCHYEEGTSCIECAQKGQEFIPGKIQPITLERFASSFEVNQRVQIKSTDLTGTIRLIRFDGRQWDYYVTWWGEDDKRMAEWLQPDELERKV